MITGRDCGIALPMNSQSPKGKPRPQSVLWRSPQLKEVIVDAALKGEITQQDVADLFAEYGLKDA